MLLERGNLANLEQYVAYQASTDASGSDSPDVPVVPETISLSREYGPDQEAFLQFLINDIAKLKNGGE